MRIALVTPYSLDTPGGVGTHVKGLARWLRGQGHRVAVIAPGTAQPEAGEILLGGAVDLPFNGSVAQLALRPGQARRAVAAIESADVVHVHEPLTPGIAYAAARAARHLVVTHHASFAPGPLTQLLRLRSSRHRPAVRLAVSEAAADTAEAATGHRPCVIPNAIDLPPAPGPEPAGPPVVAFLGRLDERRKGYGVFTQLPGRVPGARFVAIGPGGQGAAGIRELGMLDDTSRARELGRARVVVAPNLFGESFGLILVEALAHGATLAASDLPQFRAVVTDPALVSWFRPGDPEAAARAVERQLARAADPASARRYARRFAWDSVGPRLLAAYRQAAVG